MTSVTCRSHFNTGFLEALLLILLLTFGSIVIDRPTAMIDTFYTYSLNLNSKGAIDPRNVPGAMTPPLQLEFDSKSNNNYYDKTSQFRSQFTDNYFAYQLILTSAKWIVGAFVNQNDSARIPLALAISYGLCISLMVALLYTATPSIKRNSLFKTFTTILLIVCIIQLIVPPQEDNRIYSPHIVNIFKFIPYIIHPPLGHTMYSWATRSIAYTAVVLFLPLASMRKNGVYFLLSVPVLHAVCGILLFPGLLYWALASQSPDVRTRWGFIAAYASILICFMAPYAAIIKLGAINPIAIAVPVALTIAFLIAGIFLPKYRPQLRPVSLYRAIALSLLGIFFFFLLVYESFSPLLGIWTREYFIQEFSGRTLDLLRCVLIACLVEYLSSTDNNKIFTATNAFPLALQIAGVVMVMMFSGPIIADSMQDFRSYQHHFASKSQIATYSDYLFSLVMRH